MTEFQTLNCLSLPAKELTLCRKELTLCRNPQLNGKNYKRHGDCFQRVHSTAAIPYGSHTRVRNSLINDNNRQQVATVVFRILIRKEGKQKLNKLEDCLRSQVCVSCSIETNTMKLKIHASDWVNHS